MITANHGKIIAQFDKKCRELIEWAGSATPGTTAFDAESEIFGRLIEIGLLALREFFAAEARRFDGVNTVEMGGVVLKRNGQRSGVYYSVFGAFKFFRTYFRGGGVGQYPMDAALNLPPTGESDFLRQMKEEQILAMSHKTANAQVARYFPVTQSTRGTQEALSSDSADAADYCDRAPMPVPPPEATILVAQADCSGVPIIPGSDAADSDGLPAAAGAEREGAQRPTGFCEPGRDRVPQTRNGKKKMATVVSVSTHTPYLRTPEQVVESIFKESKEDGKDGSSRKPCKDGLATRRVWATLDGKHAALERAKQWADRTPQNHIRTRLCMSDGERALQIGMDDLFHGFIRILDFRHVLGYLWNAADARFGADAEARKDWVRGSALEILKGNVLSVVGQLEGWAEQTAQKSKTEPLLKAANYYRNNRDAMQYDKYLETGWPIATGLIEGSCGHLVKGRLDGSGRRWTIEGAEAMLKMTCIEENGQWDHYHSFRRRRRHEKLYGYTAATQPDLETSVCSFNTYRGYANAV